MSKTIEEQRATIEAFGFGIDNYELRNGQYIRLTDKELAHKAIDRFNKQPAAPQGVPVIAPLTPEQKHQRDNPDPNPVIAICGECKREIRRIDYYACGNNHCPVSSR